MTDHLNTHTSRPVTTRIYEWAWKQNLHASAKLVLLFLAEMASDDGVSELVNVTIFPKYHSTQMKCHFSERLFNESLSRLMVLGLIRQVGAEFWVLNLGVVVP